MDDEPVGIFYELGWVKTINGVFGLFAIFVTLIFIILIVRILRPRYRKQVGEDFVELMANKNRSCHTRVIQTIVFILLSVGLVGLTIYNVDKMIYGDPLISEKMESNTLSPSFPFCPLLGFDLALRQALYYNKFGDVEDKVINLTQFTPLIEISGENGECLLFDGKSSSKPENAAGGTYEFEFSQKNASDIMVFIGDTDENVDWTTSYPEGNEFSDVGVQIVTFSGVIQYTETRYKILNEGYTFRSFQCSLIDSDYITEYITEFTDPNNVSTYVSIIAPKNVLIQTEEPPLTLVDLCGYLTICGIFGFLFGIGKANPFGFVSEFVFKEKDKAKLEKMSKSELAGSEKLNDSGIRSEVQSTQSGVKQFKENMEITMSTRKK